MYKEWNATLDTKEKFGYGLQLQFLYAEGTSREETLEGLCLLVFSVEMDVSKVNLSLESLLLKMKSLMESCSPFFAHRKFYLKGRSRFGMRYEMGVEYFGLTLVGAEKKTRQEIVDIYDELPADDFVCLDECLKWLDAQRLPYIESWEDMEDS